MSKKDIEETKRFTIDLPDAIVEVFIDPKEKYKPEKGFGYVHGDYVYIYRGKEKKKNPLVPGSMYTSKADGHFIWVDPPEDQKDIYSVSRVICFDNKSIFKNIEDAANLKEVNSKLIEQAGDAYIVPLNTDDDVLKRAIKKVLAAKKVAVKPSKDCKDKYGITNMKSNLSNDKAHMSITYFLKWVQVLNLDAHLIIRFENSDEEVEIIDEELK